MKLRVLGAALALMLLASAGATYSVYHANQEADRSRKVLCSVLLYQRKSELSQATSVGQIERASLYYGDLIGLVDGCVIR